MVPRPALTYMQACFFTPGPPNFFLSRHISHFPQSSFRMQAGHSIQRTPRFRRGPGSSPKLYWRGILGLADLRADLDIASSQLESLALSLSGVIVPPPSSLSSSTGDGVSSAISSSRSLSSAEAVHFPFPLSGKARQDTYSILQLAWVSKTLP